MKKTAIAVAVAIAGFASAVQAAPTDNSWYAGAKLGWSAYHDGNQYSSQGGLKADQKDRLGAGAYLGYQANQYLGFEVGYDWLGRMTYEGAANTALKAQGIQFAAKVSYPVTSDLDIYTRLGGMAYRADIKSGFGDAKQTDHKYRVAPMFAVGMEYAFTQNIAARLDYQWVNNIGKGEITKARPDNSMLSLGMTYRFGQGGAAAAAAAAAASIAATGHASVASDNMFGFGIRDMNANGKEIVDAVFNEIKDKKETVKLSVVGHADRIGSKEANKTLSTHRAKSVANYFVAKGIPAQNIETRGAGNAESVTGSTCDSVTVRADLIKCLAADRRVDIDVK